MSSHPEFLDFQISSLRFCFREFHREINRGDHAVGTRDAFARNFKCSAVVGTGARKRQPERYVHAAVECVQLQRNQSLIVVHAKYRVEFAFNRSVENGVWRNGTENDFRFTSPRFSIAVLELPAR